MRNLEISQLPHTCNRLFNRCIRTLESIWLGAGCRRPLFRDRRGVERLCLMLIVGLHFIHNALHIIDVLEQDHLKRHASACVGFCCCPAACDDLIGPPGCLKLMTTRSSQR